MRNIAIEYKVIKVGDTAQSGDVIVKARPDEVSEAAIRNDARLLEIDVADRIAFCLMNNECLAHHSEIFNKAGKFIFDLSLPDGCSLLNWASNTVIEFRYRLMPDTIYQSIETAKRWKLDKQSKPLTIVIISKDTINGRKKKDGGIRIEPNIIFYNDRDFLAYADTIIQNQEKILKEREKKKIKRTQTEYLHQLFDSRENLLKRAKVAFEKGRVSLFLGAGVSIDAGLPNWNDLLKGVFENKEEKPYSYLSDRNIDAILRTCDNSNIIAGRYAYNGFGDEDPFRRRIKEVLYKSKKSSSELVNAICEAIASDKEKRIANIITYNYDDLIEMGLDDHGYKDYYSVYGKNRNTSKYLQIYHVHGMITQRFGIMSTPILSEKDYHTLYRNNHNWANVVQLYSMNTMTCFFIGMSLTDPNLRRLLDFSFSDEGPSKADINQCPHFAFLQRKALEGDKRVKVNQEHWKVQEQMLREFGINVIWYDEHSELPDLIRKIMMSAEEKERNK